MQRAITKRFLQKLIAEKIHVKHEKEAQAIKEKKKSKTKKASKVDETAKEDFKKSLT